MTTPYGHTTAPLGQLINTVNSKNGNVEERTSTLLANQPLFKGGQGRPDYTPAISPKKPRATRDRYPLWFVIAVFVVGTGAGTLATLLLIMPRIPRI